MYMTPTITQITPPFDSQIICVGEAISPVTFQYEVLLIMLKFLESIHPLSKLMLWPLGLQHIQAPDL